MNKTFLEVVWETFLGMLIAIAFISAIIGCVAFMVWLFSVSVVIGVVVFFVNLLLLLSIVRYYHG